MDPLKNISKQFLGVILAVLLGSLLLSGVVYYALITSTGTSKVCAQATPGTGVTGASIACAQATPGTGATPTVPVVSTSTVPSPLPPVQNPGSVLGIEGNPLLNFTGIAWVRISYPSCGAGHQQGTALQRTVQHYHSQGVRVLLLICQWASGPALFDTTRLKDAAQAGADAVGCGNEQMKSGSDNLYVAPADFARFFDNCQQAIHAVHPEVPIILGSLDPHVAADDRQLLLDQVSYLNQMQAAMNTQVHPGGQWNWHTQTLGLIDSWHNGYPGSFVNNLYGLFSFWAQQFSVDLNSGALGKHLWVTEGTGCFKGCGIDVTSASQVAISHILTLITDVETTLKYRVPFFFFSGSDFRLAGITWPIGVLNLNNEPKPLRQDLPMGARTLTLTCSSGNVTVADQAQLLARLYAQCSLPGDYVGTLVR